MSSKEPTSSLATSPRKEMRRPWVYVAKGCMHLLGVVCTGALITWFASDWETVQVLYGLDLTRWGEAMTAELVRHVLYSVLVWGVCALMLSTVTRHETSRRRVRVLRVARGQVMLETLIVLTPFLLLTGGLSQLIVNNIAGMLSHLSAYEAGRTYWVWSQESDRTNAVNAVGPDLACQRARLAAAAALAPVAGGPDGASGSDTQVSAMAGIMSAHFSDLATAPAGSSMTSNTDAITEAKSYVDAFDTTPFGKRASQKLRAAYANTEVTCPPPTGGMLTVEVTYHHFLAFPWFSYIFESGVKPGYTTYTRTYQLPAQAPTQ